MKKAVLSFLALLLVSPCFAACDKTGLFSSGNVKKMIEYSKSGDYEKAAKLYNNFTFKEMSEFEEYMIKNPASVPPVYLVISSDGIFKENKEQAVLFYNFGKVRATEDVRMCKDKKAAKIVALYALLAPQTVEYMQSKISDLNYLNKLFDNVIEMDNKYSDRISPLWTCEKTDPKQSEKDLLDDKSELPKIIEETHVNLKNAAQKIKDYADEN